MSKRNVIRGLPFENGISDACVAWLVRPFDRQSKDPGSNPGTFESVSFSTERILNSLKNINWFSRFKSLKWSSRTLVGKLSYLMPRLVY